MRFLKGLLLFLAALVGLLVVVALLLPRAAHVERSVTIDRHASEVFGVLNNIRRFQAWSPWFDLDPNAKYVYSGPSVGVGAKLAWAGNKDVGTGSQEFVESKPNESLKVQLDFGDMGRPLAQFRLAPVGAGTKVTWTLDQSFEGSLIGRYFGLMMDSMVGKDYEKGLAKLKSLVETFPAADITGFSGEPADLVAQKIYFISSGPIADPAAIHEALRKAYAQIEDFLRTNNLSIVGAPMTITTSYDKTLGWQYDAAIPVPANDTAPSGDIKAGATYAGKAVLFVHEGSYESIGDTITKAYAWLAVQGMRPKDRMIQEYVTNPGTTPVEQLQTRIKIPVES